MALTIPNLDRLSKDNPRLGEALLQIQVYINENVVPVPGNKTVSPPTPIAKEPPPTNQPKQPPPPRNTFDPGLREK